MLKFGFTVSSEDFIHYRKIIKSVRKSTNKTFYLFSDNNKYDNSLHSHYHVGFSEMLNETELLLLKNNIESLRKKLKNAREGIFYKECIQNIDEYLFVKHDFMMKC